MPRAKAVNKRESPKVYYVLYYHLEKGFGSLWLDLQNISSVPQGHSHSVPDLSLIILKYLF